MGLSIFQGKEYSFPVDWWSLGVLVFEMLTGDSPFQGDNEDELSTSVCTDTIEYPSWLNQESKDLLEKLLERDPTHRLGVAGDIRAHPFFEVIDWPTLEKREMEPPFKPKITGDPEEDLLDLEFLSKVSFLSDRDTGSVVPDDQLAFADFSFINPKWGG
ncbi:protein kinase C delta type-like [Anguilla rostrata]|uniref:protein kinase C delta type-like n=1 Tax=Anguilla rostrata TaxID=7938 RepID=UPI0030CD9F8C